MWGARVIFCLSVVAGLWAGCDAVGLGHTKIGDVVKNPSMFDGKEIKVRGKVIGVLKLPLIATKFYKLKDETGELLVMTGAAPPGMGVEVRVKGSVESMAITGGQSFGMHLKESQRW